MNLRRAFLSSLFFIAGMVHLISPERFLPALPESLPFKLEIIFVTGILEIVLALGLIQRKNRDFFARTSALYLLLLLPVHVYVSLKGIEIFGISSPLILWARTLFQFVLYFIALSLQDKGALIYQRWRDIIFLHYTVDKEEIQKHVPFPLDLYDGKAVLSVVPFKMDRIRFPFLPTVPAVSELLELNLRTYVRVNGIPGVYFFTLDTDSLIGEKIARWFFRLPYRYSRISGKKSENRISFNHERLPYKLSLSGEIGSTKSPSPLEVWATERYSLFLKHKGRNYQGRVVHAPWPVMDFSVENYSEEFTTLLGETKSLKLESATYTKELQVSFAPFKEI